MSKLLYTLLLLISTSCSEDVLNSDLTGVGSDGSIPKKNSPQIYVNHYDRLIQQNGIVKDNSQIETRRPYIVYYAVDSIKPEPFFKETVNFETETLRNSCHGLKHQNWMILRNSDVVEKKYYEYCIGGRYSKKDITYILNEVKSALTNLSKGLECDKASPFHVLFNCESGLTLNHDVKSRNFIIKSALQDLEIEKKFNTIANNSLSEYSLNDLYYKYPLAMSEFLYQIISFNGLNPFKKKDFVPVYHFKSHGHIDYAITGLLDHQIASKQKRQQEMLALNNSTKIGLTAFIPGFRTKIQELETKAFKQIYGIEYNKQISNSDSQSPNKSATESLSQDNVCGLKTSGLSTDEKSSFMSATFEDGLAVGSVFLGNHIGFTPDDLIETISKEFNESKFSNSQTPNILNSKHKTLFMFVESCDAGLGGVRWPIKNENIKNKIAGLYSANGSMWYRNIDWNVILESIGKVKNSKIHASLLQFYLTEITKDITIYEAKDSHKYLSNYEKIMQYFVNYVTKQKESGGSN